MGGAPWANQHFSSHGLYFHGNCLSDDSHIDHPKNSWPAHRQALRYSEITACCKVLEVLEVLGGRKVTKSFGMFWPDM